MVKLECNDLLAQKHYLLVEECIVNRINHILKLGYILRKKNKINIKSNLKTYLNSLLSSNKLKELICLPPKDYEKYIKKVKRSYPEFLNPNHDSNYILRNIFIKHGYDKKEFNKLQFIRNIDIDVCPYCNRHYIYVVKKKNKGEKNVQPEIDHFYPKTKYPFFAISYYNLIPSCKTCNGFGGKEDSDPLDPNRIIVNPYLLEDSDFTFSYNIKNANILNSVHNKDSIEIVFKNGKSGNIEVFNLKQLYEMHSDHVLELIVKSKYRYSNYYREYLSSFKNLNFTQKEIDRLILGNYSETDEVNKRPLAKLYQDIGKELGLIKN